MGIDLIQECRDCLALVAEDVEDGILYMDAGAGEAFHFNGGLPTLLELGARAICSLENASPFDSAISWRGLDQEPVEKIVILTSKLLTESHHHFLRCLQLHQSVKKCTIWTSISEEAHGAHPNTSFGLDAFHDYRNSLVRDLAASASMPGGIEAVSTRAPSKEARRETDSDFQPYQSKLLADEDKGPESTSSLSSSASTWQIPTIEFKHFPLMVCSLTKSLFVLPSAGAVAQAPLSLNQDMLAMSQGLPAIDIASSTGGDAGTPAGATLLAHCLQHMAAQLDLKPEVFTLGPLAHVVGKVMTGLSSPPEGLGHLRRPAGLILIDRTQDIITSSSHGDSLLDRCFASLFRRVLPIDQTSVDQLREVRSSTILRPPMDVRIPVDSEQVKVCNDGEIGTQFPFSPIMASCGVANGERFSHVTSTGTEEVNQSIASPWEYERPIERTDLMGGSLSTCWDRRGSEYLESLVEKRTKDSVLLIRKWLQDALRREKVTIPGKGRLGSVSVNELRSLRRALTEKPEVAFRHMALIQLARATEEALGGDVGLRWDAAASAERILMLSAGDSTQSLALQLCDIVQQCALSIQAISENQSAAPSGLLSLRDALGLAIVGYGLAGETLPGGSHGSPFAWEEEHALKEAVFEAVLKGQVGAPLGFLRSLEGALATLWHGDEIRRNSGIDHNIVKKQPKKVDDDWDGWEDSGDEDEEEEQAEEYGEMQIKLELRDRLGEVFSVLHKVAAACAQSPLQEVPLPVESQISAGASLHTGLIFKVLSLIFAKMDIPGLEHHASGMGRFFKGGFGRFGIRPAKPKVSDQKLLLVFVIGGLNFVEVREAREAQAAIPGGEGIELLLGGTTLLTPSDMYNLTLGACGAS